MPGCSIARGAWMSQMSCPLAFQKRGMIYTTRANFQQTTTRAPASISQQSLRRASPFLFGSPAPRRACFNRNCRLRFQQSQKRSFIAPVMVLTESKELEVGTKAPAFTVIFLPESIDARCFPLCVLSGVCSKICCFSGTVYCSLSK